MRLRGHRSSASLVSLLFMLSACSPGGDGTAPATSDAPPAGAAETPLPTPPPASTATVPPGPQLADDDLGQLVALFDDQPYTGGQTAPRVSKWITPDTYVFLQFDAFPPEEASEVTYVGVAVKGVFCAEAQPDAEGGSFTHFHRPEAAEYQEGHGGEPGAQGYWLSWMAVDSFEARDGRAVVPGVDYEFSPTPPPSCGSNVPSADFAAPDEKALSAEDLAEFVAFFDDQLLEGGQQPPRLSKWLNEDVALFIQLDAGEPEEATINYVGIYQRGVFCDSAQPHADFTHYHRLTAAEYAEGHGGQPGESSGFWLAWMATQSFEARDGRAVTPGVDRQFSPTPPPSC
jgi:hypothetical protein